jgi:Flp pilus assembly protein TadD
MNRHLFKLAASSVVLGLTLAGCASSTRGNRASSFLAKAPKASHSARFYQIAQIALKNGNIGAATRAMEAAVEISPRDAGYRMGLAELYMRTGRFWSAETTFADALALNPGDSRSGFYLALSQIAQGKTHIALAQLDSMDASVAPADIGLAYALAGNTGRAIELLEPAARSMNATGRVRQNLALAYALAGDWKKAKITASQDVAPAELNKRMAQWAGLADPSASAVRVAALLGTTAVDDPGQPTRLALAPAAPVAPVESVFAEAPAPAAPVSVPVEAPAAPLEAPAAPAQSPAPVEFVAAPIEPVPAPVQAVVEEIPAAPIADAPSAPVVYAVAETTPIEPEAIVPAPEVQARYVQAAQSLIAPEAPVEDQAPAVPQIDVRPAIVSVPVPAFEPKRKPGFDSRPQKLGAGRFVVQIGAYRTAGQVEKAWLQARRRFGFNGSEQPLSTTIRLPGKGLLHRLSVASFSSHSPAARMCQSIKARGGACFVRATAGDTPMRWASSNGRDGRA